jgi:hypothetical protein
MKAYSVSFMENSARAGGKGGSGKGVTKLDTSLASSGKVAIFPITMLCAGEKKGVYEMFIKSKERTKRKRPPHLSLS